MAEILHLNEAHEQTQMLLPWFVNGSLEADEAALVEAHIGQCELCRADLAANRLLRQAYAAQPIEIDFPHEPVPAPSLPAARLRFLRRRVALGWALAGPGLAAAAAALILFVSLPAADPPGEYRLLGSGQSPRAGNAIILFQPEIAERDLRAALDEAGAQVVGGPTVSGAFLLRVDQSERAAALHRLRSNAKVILAEPIDAAAP